MHSLFISDLHLCEERPYTVELLHRFLLTEAPNAQRLYILGDLFEHWAGDDAASPMHLQVASWLKALTQQKTQVFFMSGNRDFLIGKKFSQLCGWTRLRDPHVISHQQKNVLLMHGDTLCTDDVDYIRFRKKYRHPLRIFFFLRLPLAMRLKIIHKFRGLSQGKDMTIMDVNNAAVLDAFNTHQAQWLIHGHTHRPAVHSHILPHNETGTRFVLSDWDKTGQYLRMDNDTGFTTHTIE